MSNNNTPPGGSSQGWQPGDGSNSGQYPPAGGQPPYGQQQPGYGDQRPSYGGPQQHQQPGYGNQQPSYGQQTPYGQNQGGGYPGAGQQGSYPGSGQPQGGYPGGGQQGAYPGPGQPQGGYPAAGQPRPQGSPYASQGSSPAGSGPGGNKKLLMIVGAAVVGLLLLALILSQTVFKRPATPTTANPVTPGASAPASLPPAQADTAAAAVRGYLEALAAGDAAKALSYASAEPASKTFLTNEVLAASNQAAPITDINVPEDTTSTSYASLSASYKVGDRVINESYTAQKSGNTWRLNDVAADVDFSYLNKGDLELRLNGVAADADKLYLFPGVYTVTSNNERVSFGNGKLLVDSPTSYPSTTDLRPALTKQGTEDVREAAQAKLNACLKTRERSPKGCGIGIDPPSGVKLNYDTLRWTITRGAKAMQSMKVDLDYQDPTIAKGYASISLDARVKGTNGRSYIGYQSISSVEADISGETVTVTLD